MATTRLTGRLVDGGIVTRDAVVVVDEGTIAYAGRTEALPAIFARVPEPAGWRPGLTIVPGLVDIHCHGGDGGEFGGDEEGMRRAAAHHLRHGTTTLVGSVASLPGGALVTAVRRAAALVTDGTLAGIHIEGPFLSELRSGAQRADALSDVDRDLIELLGHAAPGAILQMTYAPERDPDGVAPALLAALGAVGAIGHTDCDARTASLALERAALHSPVGTRPLVTHLFNGMPPWHHRAPGPVSTSIAAAKRGDAVAEFVADGSHLAPETVTMMFALVGPWSLALVSDSAPSSGLPDGSYLFSGRDILVVDGVATTPEGRLAGSTSTLLDVLRWTVRVAGVEPAAAVTAATSTPARALGLQAGTVAPGLPADLLVVDDDLELVAVLAAGTPVT